MQPRMGKQLLCISLASSNPAGIKVTRLARGLAVGADIEYAGRSDALRAIENRTELIGSKGKKEAST